MGDRVTNHSAAVRLAVLVLAGCLSVPAGARAVPPPASGEDDAVRELTLRAAFVFNFARFVEWPREALPDTASLRLGVFAPDAVPPPFAALAGRRVRGHLVRVLPLRPADDPSGCHLIYCNDATPAQQSALLAGARGHPVLTVGEGRGFMDGGGMIELLTRDNRLRFRIRPDAVRGVGLRVGASLLQLADEVLDRPREGSR
ncbi:MAG: YfiR family protein [Candidatus Krumholzibacteriia bacterium]